MHTEAVKVHGFFRLQIINPDGSIAGDSGIGENGKLINGDGYRKNLVVNLGFQDYLCQTLGGMAGSKTISHVALGTGGAPIATDTSLAGEIMSSTQRKTVSPSTIASKTIQFTAAFASANSFLTASSNLSNIGLFNTSTAGTLFAGNTYTSSACATNQSVNVTYQIRFS
jgi:hypothetical protein